MSIQAVAWVLEHSESRGLARLVLISLANHVNDQGECWPSIRTVAREAGVGKSTAARCIGELAGLGELVVVESGDARRSARYRFTHLQVSHSGTQSPPRERSVPRRVGQNHQEPIHPSSKDGLFEAFFEAWTGRGYESGEKLARTARSRLNAAVKEARTAGYTAEEVLEHAANYRKAWPGIECTPQALLGNWPRFEPGAKPVPCTECDNAGIVWMADGKRTTPDNPNGEALLCKACRNAA